MKDNVFLILTNFTTIIINTIIAMPFTSNNLFHVKVININYPGSKSDKPSIIIIIIIQAPTLNPIILIFT